MSESMIERVEMAIASILWTDSFEGTDQSQRDKMKEAARAAIEAMREPTDAAIKSVSKLDVYWTYEADGRPGEPRDVWRAMIDAALEPNMKAQ